MMSADLNKALYDLHPSYAQLGRSKSISISNRTLEMLAGIVHALNHEKKQRFQKVYLFETEIGYTFQYFFIGMFSPFHFD
jgi:hypothetical protein